MVGEKMIEANGKTSDRNVSPREKMTYSVHY